MSDQEEKSYQEEQKLLKEQLSRQAAVTAQLQSSVASLMRFLKEAPPPPSQVVTAPVPETSQVRVQSPSPETSQRQATGSQNVEFRNNEKRYREEHKLLKEEMSRQAAATAQLQSTVAALTRFLQGAPPLPPLVRSAPATETAQPPFPPVSSSCRGRSRRQNGGRNRSNWWQSYQHTQAEERGRGSRLQRSGGSSFQHGDGSSAQQSGGSSTQQGGSQDNNKNVHYHVHFPQ